MRISDWSSDVCSSDLIQVDRLLAHASAHTCYNATIRFNDSQIVAIETGDRPAMRSSGATDILAVPPLSNAHDHGRRSEERRVGKEGVSTCRSRWSPYH